MTAILNAEDLYHTGVVVADLDAAMARLSAIGGYEWTAPLEFSLPVRIADNPLNCVALGAGRALEDPLYRGVLHAL